MGKNNQQRRAAKKRRQRDAARAGDGQGLPRPDLDDLVESAADEPDGPRRDRAASRLAGFGAPAAQACDRRIAHGVRRAWSLGYAPAELLHVLERLLTPGHGDLVAGAVLREHPPHPTPAWAEQIAQIASDRSVARIDVSSVGSAVDVVAALRRLPGVPPVTGHAPKDGLDNAVLVRVRALLAKAESTEFDAEAESLTAKAQELITRHAIDAARLGSTSPGDQPGRRRILLHDPYISSKALLVTIVAEANRCKAAFTADLGWSTVVGYDADLDATEVLVASLLAQCVGAMARLGPQRDASGRSRTRSFRTAFIRGFAVRIGQRLAEANDDVVGGIDDAQQVLPVLASRAEQVTRAFDTAFPQLQQRDVGQVTNGHGWISGVAAADMATLHAAAAMIGR